MRTNFIFIEKKNASNVTVLLIQLYLIHFICAYEKIFIGVTLPLDQTDLPWSYKRGAKTGITQAVQFVNEQMSMQQNYSVGYEVNFRDSQCSDLYGPLAVVGFMKRHSINMLLGPACTDAMLTVALLSPHWNIPLLTVGALNDEFNNKEKFSFLTRMGGSFKKLSEFILVLLKKIEMSSAIASVSTMKSAFGKTERYSCEYIIESFSKHYTIHKQEILEEFSYSRQFFDEMLGFNSITAKEILLQLSKTARICLVCASPAVVRELLITAVDVKFNLTEYVFINIDILAIENEKPWYDDSDTDERNLKAKEGFRSILFIQMKSITGSTYDQFNAIVIDSVQASYGRFKDNKVNHFVTALHDAVLLYALAIEEILASNKNITDGKSITAKMWNRSFEGMAGNVTIDENGDREMQFSLLDMDAASGRLRVVGEYDTATKHYVELGEIDWAGGLIPPIAIPKCGFANEYCSAYSSKTHKKSSQQLYLIVTISVLLPIAVVCIVLALLFRFYKREAEIAEEHWRVFEKDIIFMTSKDNSDIALGKKSSYSKVNALGLDKALLPEKNLYNNAKIISLPVAVYKGAKVAVKFPCGNESLSISINELLEFKMMRSLQNEHIVRFVGVCIDTDFECILLEHCEKGSLQDILDNEAIVLDKMFKMSLIQDIAGGMAYIHKSAIGSHGNLTSGSCLINSRFVLKISDFGVLSTWSSSGKTVLHDENCYDKLWTAPELLRLQQAPLKGTRRGDIYSFGIICHEIVYRRGVFWPHTETLTPRDICEALMTECSSAGGDHKPLRPSLEPEENNDCCIPMITSFIERCWHESPTMRPNFCFILKVIHQINNQRGHRKSSIVDNLLTRMKRYTSDLEVIVDQRTAKCLEQQKKAEEVLQLMLPKPVVKELLEGKTVEAEKFDCVTVYFGDIYDFESLTAEWSPIEVIDLIHEIHTVFDSTIEAFDVFKIEIIGNSYMVVSGCPVRNGDLHAAEICRMALALLKASNSFTIKQQPDTKLQLRIGVNSGPVCAGILGTKTPKYSIFGDTVNTASRMQTNGAALSIHVSSETKAILDTVGTFNCTCRGGVKVKGKGVLTTWWLNGEEETNAKSLDREKMIPSQPISTVENIVPKTLNTLGLL